MRARLLMILAGLGGLMTACSERDLSRVFGDGDGDQRAADSAREYRRG